MFDQFLIKLQKRAAKNSSFNPYRDPKILKNLEDYLYNLYNNYFDGVMLVAEAPGYSGCAITGIPFTTVKILEEKPHKILQDNFYLGKRYSDISGEIIWKYLNKKERLPLLWNAFPFHPYIKYNKQSNRKPTKQEILEGKWYIDQLVDIFKPRVIASIGRVGQHTLQQNYPDKHIEYIRHPSYGGKADFILGMDKIYHDV